MSCRTSSIGFIASRDRPGRSHEGSGIGLALVHELVKLHRGDLTVDSEPGRGSTFTVSLPLGAAHLSSEDR